MKIETVAQLEQIKKSTGMSETDFLIAVRAITGGAELWIFVTEQDVMESAVLTVSEQRFFLDKLRNGEGWAGKIRENSVRLIKALLDFQHD